MKVLYGHIPANPLETAWKCRYKTGLFYASVSIYHFPPVPNNECEWFVPGTVSAEDFE